MRAVASDQAAESEFSWLGTQGTLIPPNEFFDAVEKKKFNGDDINIKSLWSFRSNLFATYPERNSWLKAIENIDLIVINEIMMTTTAQWADIVLPVPTAFEYEDVVDPIVNPFVAISEKAIDPLYESKTEFEVAQLLADSMGIGQILDFTYNEFLGTVFDGSPIADAFGITLDRLREKKVMRMVPYASDGGAFVHGEGGVFPTPTGRAQFYLETPVTNMDYGQTWDVELERLPYFELPAEAWNQSAAGYEKLPLAEKYPLTCFNEHTKWRSHSSFSYTPVLREIDTEPHVFLSVVDAEARGIRSGDLVRVFNDRGSVKVKARVTGALRPGMTNIPHGWQVDQFVEGHFQDLTTRAHSPICVNGSFNDTLVEVEKV
jgi:molybdopterin-containing oxidoreductase family molybdopterin binding subunit